MGARASYQVGTVDTGETSCLVLPTDRAQITEVPVLLCAGRGATAWQMFADPYTAHFVRPLVRCGETRTSNATPKNVRVWLYARSRRTRGVYSRPAPRGARPPPSGVIFMTAPHAHTP